MSQPTLEQIEAAVIECLTVLNQAVPVLFSELYLAREALNREADIAFGLVNGNHQEDRKSNGSEVHGRGDDQPTARRLPMDTPLQAEGVVLPQGSGSEEAGSTRDSVLPDRAGDSGGSEAHEEDVEPRVLLQEVGRKIRSKHRAKGNSAGRDPVSDPLPIEARGS